MVFCPYHPGSREKLFWEPTANGLAAGREAAAADVAGLLEVIERDALAVSWLLQIPGLELSPEDALGEEYAATMYAVLRGGVEARLALVSLDIPLPICVAAIYDQSSMPCVSFGAAARTDVRSAAKKALCEAALARYTMKLAIALLVGEPSCELACYDPKTYQEHGLAWARPENAVQTTWVFGNRAVSCHELEASHMPPGEVLNYVVELVGAAGYPVYSCDLSTPELATAGWAVHRLLVPGLQPLNPGRYRRMLRSERLSKVHRWLGQNGSCYKISDFIHPFC
jgi:ribosomal protein S12 methylthiotransferase accessory factor